MKNIIIFLFLAVITNSFGQNSAKKADRLFERLWYKEASVLYEKELNKIEKSNSKLATINDSTYVQLLKRAGDSYFFNTDMKHAYVWYDKLVSNFNANLEPEYIFRYAHTLEGIGKYKEAEKWMKVFSKKAKSKDNRSVLLNQEQLTLEDVLDIESDYTLKNVSVNTKYSDFGAMYYKDQLVFSSAIDSSNYHTRIYHWNEQPFLDMYLGELDATASDVKLIDEFSKELNTKYHEATLAFSPDETKVYFTRNNYDGDLHRDRKGTNHLKLYSAELVEDDKGVSTWQNVKELPFNSEDYSVGHPAVSSDGKLLYFVSDMPGSIGATDIFVVDILENDSNNPTDNSSNTGYSTPRNLGDKINTTGREMFPYITHKALYFASDGHLGLGGLDIYKSPIINANFSKPLNLGTPINSNLDDFGLIIKEVENTGFICSNRLAGKGDDDIYSFVRIHDNTNLCEQAINGYATNSVTEDGIADVEIKLLSDDGKLLETTKTNNSGAYTFKSVLSCDTVFKIIANKSGYKLKTLPVRTLNESGETIASLVMETLDELIVEQSGELKIEIGIIYFDLDKSFIRSDASNELDKIVLLMEEYPEMVIKIESHTDSRSSHDYNMKLSDRRAKSTRDYIISQGIDANRIESAKGFGETQLINNCKDKIPCSEELHQLNRRSEFKIIKM